MNTGFFAAPQIISFPNQPEKNDNIVQGGQTVTVKIQLFFFFFNLRIGYSETYKSFTI